MSKKGFTLLEIMIAVSIAAFGITAIILSFSIAVGGAIDTESTGIALHLAEDRLEEMHNLDYATGLVSETRAAVSGFPLFERQVDISEPFTDLKQAIVTVYWKSKGTDVSTILRTYFSKN